MNILIPMAGEGSRFKAAGYTFPKPLIEVMGKPMIQWVIESLKAQPNDNFIFIVKKEHYYKYNLKDVFSVLLTNKFSIVCVDETTEGAACTTLLAKNYIDNDVPLLIANSDQYAPINEINFYPFSHKPDGIIYTFESVHPKWSFVRRSGGRVVEVAEKKPISNEATCGIYWWQYGSDYVRYAEQMIAKNIRTNNEFYVCPVFNEAIADKRFIMSLGVKEMWGLGTPEDLEYFERNYERK